MRVDREAPEGETQRLMIFPVLTTQEGKLDHVTVTIRGGKGT